MARAQARVRRDEVLAQSEALSQRVSLEVYEAFRRMTKNVALVEAARTSRIAAEDGLRVSLDLWETGIGQAFRLLRLYERTFRLQRLEIVREFELRVSIAELATAMGDFDLYLDWSRSGRVSVP
jgi:hypothetical protein